MNFPKTLFGFYFRYGFKPFAWTIGIWAALFMFEFVLQGVMSPLSEKLFIGLFEQTVPIGQTFIHFALPTTLFLIFVFFTTDILVILNEMLRGRWMPKVSNKISEVLNDYVHSQSQSFFTKRMPGKINSQINYIANGMNTLRTFCTIIASIIVMMLNMGLILGINHYVAICLVGALIFRFVYSIFSIKILNNASKRASESSSTLFGHIMDSLSNFSIVKLFSGRAHEERYLKKSRAKSVSDTIYSAFVQRWFWAVPGFLWTAMYGVTLLLCVYLYTLGEMKISEIVFTISVQGWTMFAISQIVGNIPTLTTDIGSAQQSYKELIQPIEVTDVPNAPELNLTRGEIVLDKVTFAYGRKKVLDGLSLTIKPGEKIGLVGSSGAGKTTLVNLLMRMYDPKRGAIYFDGQNIHDVAQDSLRNNITFIPQEPTLFNRTLFENIAYGKSDATLRDVRAAAKNAALDAFIMDSEKKYDSYVGDRGIKLSGGQKQRVAIARAFLKNAPILILDEATSALDSETEAVIQNSFNELSAGRTTIAIAHRLSTLRGMDRIIVMDHGKIAEQGTHAALLRRGGIYAKLWKMQTGGFIKE